MKVVAWIFLLYGIFLFVLGSVTLFTPYQEVPGTTDWIIERKVRRKPFINGAISFIIAGSFFKIAKENSDIKEK